jgi:predicted metal-dependent peptidase
MTMSNLSAEQRLTRATVWLMNEPQYAAFSGLYLMGSVEVKDGLPTAATNGRDEFYGREFLDKLTDQEIRGLKLHETWHKAGRHMMIWRYLTERDARVANMAMDFVINLFIHDSDPQGRNVKLPEGGLLDEQYRGMDVGEVFEKLMKDGHGTKRIKVRIVTKDGTGQGEPDSMDEHDWDGAAELTAEEAEQLAEEIDSALRQGALMAGKLGGDLPRGLEEMLAPKVRWEDEMREFVTAACTGHDLPSYRKPNRRYMGGKLILPTHISETVGRIVIGVDASGSIWGSVLTAFLSEVNELCRIVKPEAVDLLYWDSSVAGHEVYDENSYAGMLTSTKPRGGGGTSPQCVIDYIKEKAITPECIVMLTDGEVCGWGEPWPAPTLWCITEKRIVSPVGRSVHIDVG